MATDGMLPEMVLCAAACEAPRWVQPVAQPLDRRHLRNRAGKSRGVTGGEMHFPIPLPLWLSYKSSEIFLCSYACIYVEASPKGPCPSLCHIGSNFPDSFICAFAGPRNKSASNRRCHLHTRPCRRALSAGQSDTGVRAAVGSGRGGCNAGPRISESRRSRASWCNA